MQPVPFGTLLKHSRRAAGLTQEDLAAHAGYSAAYISLLERNARLPTPATISALAEALELPFLLYLPSRAKSHPRADLVH